MLFTLPLCSLERRVAVLFVLLVGLVSLVASSPSNDSGLTVPRLLAGLTILALGSALALSARRPSQQLETSLVVSALAVAGDGRETAQRPAGQTSSPPVSEFHRVFQEAPIGMALIGLDLRFLAANRALCQLLGYSPEEFATLTSADVTHPDDFGIDVEQARKLLAGEVPSYRREKRYRTKSGDTVWVRVTATLIRDADGTPLYAVLMVEDVTQARQVRDWYAVLLRAAPVGAYVVQDHRFAYVNEQFERYTGYRREELAGMDPLALVLPEDRVRVRESAVRMLKGERREGYEYRFIAKDGQVRWVFETVTSIRYQNARATLGYFVDITEQKRAQEALRASAVRLNALHTVGKAVLSQRDPEELLSFAVAQASELLCASVALLVLADGDGRLQYARAFGPYAHLFRGREPRSDGIQARVVRSAQPFLSTDPLADGWALPELAAQMPLHCLISSPIVVQGTVVGSLTLLGGDHERCYTPEDLAVLVLFADYVSLGLEHARLYEQLREQADRDFLTGLFNHRVLMESLDRQLAHARRTGRPFCVLMMDLDNFKRVNDTYGHLGGDAVLRELARRLRQVVRTSDIVGRYGGEEFLVILPETTKAEAQAVAQRIHHAVSGASFLLPSGDEVTLRISIGVASYPQDGDTVNGLVAAADLACYEAKRRGGAQTVIAASAPIPL